MPLWQFLLVTLAAAALAMAAVWAVQRATRNAGIVDLAWSAGIGVAALAAGVLAEGAVARRALVAALGAAWGFRLALYLWRRTAGAPEDGRYQALRAQHGDRIDAWLFGFFQFQAVTIPLFALPMFVALRRPGAALDLQDAAGVVVWLLAVGGESLADAQLARFRSDPANKGRTCRSGLWRYSRHPNYFFEWLHWFAYVVIGVGAPSWGLTFLGPALMLLFLYKVTGIPTTEQRALQTRGEDYRRYQQETSAFVPWFPRRAER
jgi:steroid 5-alpha reductase family enzyme